jgi:uncharacterized iron-regulated membrane protein
MSSFLAHGGTLGAIVEGAAALAIVALAVGVWLRERKTRQADEDRR